MSSAPFPASWLKSTSHQRELIINRQGLDPSPALGIMKLSISGPSGVFFFFLRLLVAIPRLLLCILGSYQPRYERAGNNSMNIFLLFYFFLKSNSKLQSYKALLFPFSFFFFFFFFFFFPCLFKISFNRIHILIVWL